MCWNCYWWWQLTHILHCQWAKTSINNSKSVVNVFRASCNGHVLFAVFLLFPYLSRYGTNKKLPTKKPAKNTRAYGWGLALSITQQLEFSPSNQLLQLWKKRETTLQHVSSETARFLKPLKEEKHMARDENTGFTGYYENYCSPCSSQEPKKANFLTD